MLYFFIPLHYSPIPSIITLSFEKFSSVGHDNLSIKYGCITVIDAFLNIFVSMVRPSQLGWEVALYVQASAPKSVAPFFILLAVINSQLLEFSSSFFVDALKFCALMKRLFG